MILTRQRRVLYPSAISVRLPSQSAALPLALPHSRSTCYVSKRSRLLWRDNICIRTASPTSVSVWYIHIWPSLRLVLYYLTLQCLHRHQTRPVRPLFCLNWRCTVWNFVIHAGTRNLTKSTAIIVLLFTRQRFRRFVSILSMYACKRS